MRCTSIKAWIEPTRGSDWPSSIFLPDFSVYISLLLKHSLFSLSIYCYSGTPFLSTDCDYITGKFFYWINPYILTHINTNNLNSFNNLSLVIIIPKTLRLDPLRFSRPQICYQSLQASMRNDRSGARSIKTQLYAYSLHPPPFIKFIATRLCGHRIGDSDRISFLEVVTAV